MKNLGIGRELQGWQNMRQNLKMRHFKFSTIGANIKLIFQFIFDTIFYPFSLITSLYPRATVVTHHA